jgi:hypothetical protein
MARTEHPSQVAVVKPFPADIKGQEFDVCPHLRPTKEIWVFEDADGLRLPGYPVIIPDEPVVVERTLELPNDGVVLTASEQDFASTRLVAPYAKLFKYVFGMVVFKGVFGVAFDGYSRLFAPDAVRNQRLQPRKEGENRCNIGTRDVCIHFK